MIQKFGNSFEGDSVEGDAKPTLLDHRVALQLVGELSVKGSSGLLGFVEGPSIRDDHDYLLAVTGIDVDRRTGILVVVGLSKKYDAVTGSPALVVAGFAAQWSRPVLGKLESNKTEWLKRHRYTTRKPLHLRGGIRRAAVHIPVD